MTTIFQKMCLSLFLTYEFMSPSLPKVSEESHRAKNNMIKGEWGKRREQIN
jgi:hypothetical protein